MTIIFEAWVLLGLLLFNSVLGAVSLFYLIQISLETRRQELERLKRYERLRKGGNEKKNF